MAIEHPKIDRRIFQDIKDQILGKTGLKGLREYYVDSWKSSDSNDPGIVLTNLFGKLTEIILAHLNRIPEKNYIAFLDLLGIDRLTGNWARTPVKFFLLVGNTTGGFVPAGAQLATGTTESGQVHLFETEKRMFVTPASFKKVISLVPPDDTYTDISSFADATDPEGKPVFSGETLLEHILYIAHDSLLGFPEPVDLTIDLTIAGASIPAFPSVTDWKVVWERYGLDKTGKVDWVKITSNVESFPDHASQLLESGEVKFQNFEGTARSPQGKVNEGGGEANWIRAILTTPLKPGLYLPQVKKLELGVTINRSDVLIDAAFYNTIPLDISKDFHPFGREPRLADTFYLASNEAFSKPGARIALQILYSPGISITPTNLTLLYETWIGSKWDNVLNLTDQTVQFSVLGKIEFTLPDKLEQVEVNGVKAYWLRIRIARGNYGGPDRYVPKPGTSPVEYEFQPGFKPPVLSSITLGYSKHYPLEIPQKCLTDNNFHFEDQLESLPKGKKVKEFYPFVKLAETEPSLYLGFDQKFGDVAVSLFFYIEEKFEENGSLPSSGAAPSATSLQVVWDYSIANGRWKRLEVIGDDTNYLTTAGVVSFVGPNDFAKANQFGENLFWLRARELQGKTPENLRIKGVYLNTVWAANYATIADEVLGSGNGKQRQALVFLQKPVLNGERLYVKESEAPSDEARQAIEAKEAIRLGKILTAQEKDALVQKMKNAVSNEVEIWVRWHRVDSFFDSGPQSRHYVLDRINGVVTFGDGQKGMIPPIGRDNIKADYQSGGGLPANKEVKAGVIKELRTSLLFVDRVTNVMDARGGSAHEDLEMVLERGPQTIKHRDRAVTTEDYVWLAKEASTLVRQVKCLPTTNAALQFEAGAVTLLLVPDSNETKPRPDQELIRTVKNYILERCLSVIEPNIYIIPPDYVPVAVNATVKALVPEESSVVEGSILSRLNTFLHPVKGGPTSRGWEFGRYVYISEIHQLIEDIEGVDVVESVVLNNDPLLTEIEIKDNQLPISGTHDIIMKTKN